MGQSRTQESSGGRIGSGRSIDTAKLHLSIFLTDFGWFGLLGREGAIAGLTIGHTSSDGVREAIEKRWTTAQASEDMTLVESDWLPKVRRRLEDYAAGERVDFADCRLESPPRTPFQQRVLKMVRGIGYGETLTYGEVAATVGAPRAARAVGSVMASNRVPIIIPCHRVVAAGSKPGGFSAPTGVRLKEQMLAMEAGTGD